MALIYSYQIGNYTSTGPGTNQLAGPPDGYTLVVRTLTISVPFLFGTVAANFGIDNGPPYTEPVTIVQASATANGEYLSYLWNGRWVIPYPGHLNALDVNGGLYSFHASGYLLRGVAVIPE